MTNTKQPDAAQQTRIVNAFLRHYPQMEEAVTAAKHIIANVTFPIPSYHDFVDAMGGRTTALQLNGRSYTLHELEQLVPSYYFPIANENDLIAKLGDLFRRRSPSRHMSAPSVMPADAPKPDVPPPSMSAEDIHRVVAKLPHEAARIGGIKR